MSIKDDNKAIMELAANSAQRKRNRIPFASLVPLPRCACQLCMFGCVVCVKWSFELSAPVKGCFTCCLKRRYSEVFGRFCLLQLIFGHFRPLRSLSLSSICLVCEIAIEIALAPIRGG